jgi:hypothetical protein
MNRNSIVDVFPCVKRDDVDSRLMSEKNITNILKSVTDKESYVISWDGEVLKCVVKGYYFEVKETRSGDKYAHIDFNSDGLLKGDNEDIFEGLVIDSNKTENDLILCENGVVPSESLEKFYSTSLSVDLTYIDCGELN